jgi:hypothetical protein
MSPNTLRLNSAITLGRAGLFAELRHVTKHPPSLPAAPSSQSDRRSGALDAATATIDAQVEDNLDSPYAILSAGIGQGDSVIFRNLVLDGW